MVRRLTEKIKEGRELYILPGESQVEVNFSILLSPRDVSASTVTVVGRSTGCKSKFSPLCPGIIDEGSSQLPDQLKITLLQNPL